jgi:NADP-dependent 3-hydroxy acid dehydrogenase YdfG
MFVWLITGELTCGPDVDLIRSLSGTSSGFGRHLVHIALAKGDHVVATARDIEQLSDFPRSDNLRILQLDVDWDDEAIKATVDKAAQFWGSIDVLVNNAGYGIKGMCEELGCVLAHERCVIV